MSERARRASSDGWLAQIRRASSSVLRLRLGAVATVIFATAAAAGLVLLGLVLVPEEVVVGRGSPLPLSGLILLALLAGTAIYLTRRALGPLVIPLLAREAERATGLPAGELVGALELDDPGPQASVALSRLHRESVARRLNSAPRAQLFPTTAHRWARRLAISFVCLMGTGALLVTTAVARPGSVRTVTRALGEGWGIAFPPALPSLTLEPGDIRVPRGETVPVRIVAPGRSEVRLVWRVLGEMPRGRVLKTDEAGRATGILGPVESTLRYWAETPDGAVSDTFSLGLREPLLIQSLRVRLVYPEYLSRVPEIHARPVPPLIVPEGTLLEVEGTSNYSLESASLVRVDSPSAGHETKTPAPRERVSLEVTKRRFSGAFRPRASGSWRWNLKAETGGRPLLPEPLRVRVVPDGLPSIHVVYPGKDTLMRSGMVLPLVVDVRDDIGLRRVELVSWPGSQLRNEEAVTVEAVGVYGGEQRRAVIRPLLDVREKGFLPGDTVSYLFRAYDARHGPAVSDTFRAWLPSLSEELARAARVSEELSREAAESARRARDLERSARAAEKRAGVEDPWSRGAAGPDEPGSELSFEGTEEARRAQRQARALESSLSALGRTAESLAEEASRSPIGDPHLVEPLQELRQLYEELQKGPLKERLAALEQALEKLDRQALQAALRELAHDAEAVRRRVEDSLGLLERVVLEQALRATRSEAERLRADQLATAAEEERTAPWAGREEELAEETQQLATRLEELKRRLEEAGMVAAADSSGRAEGEVEGAETRMRTAAARAREVDSLRPSRGDGQAVAASSGSAASNRQAASGRSAASGREPAAAAVQRLENAAAALSGAQGVLNRNWRDEALGTVRRARSEALALAREEEALGRRLYGVEALPPDTWQGRQAAVREGLERLSSSLASAGQRTVRLDGRIGDVASALSERMDDLLSRMAAGGNRRRPSREETEGLSEGLNELALRLLAAEKAVQAAQSASGREDALRRMATLAQQQQGLAQQTGGLVALGEVGRNSESILERLAAEQAEIGRKLREMTDEELLGRPAELAEEAERLAQRLSEGRPVGETVDGQRRLFGRMLDAGRTLEKDELDPTRRESKTGRGMAGEVPSLDSDVLRGPRFPRPSEALLQTLAPFYRPLVYDYFDRLNNPVRRRSGTGASGRE